MYSININPYNWKFSYNTQHNPHFKTNNSSKTNMLSSMHCSSKTRYYTRSIDWLHDLIIVSPFFQRLGSKIDCNLEKTWFRKYIKCQFKMQDKRSVKESFHILIWKAFQSCSIATEKQSVLWLSLLRWHQEQARWLVVADDVLFTWAKRTCANTSLMPLSLQGSHCISSFLRVRHCGISTNCSFQSLCLYKNGVFCPCRGSFGAF